MEIKLILSQARESIYQDKQETFILSSQVERWAACCIKNGSGEGTSSSIAYYIFSSEVRSCIYWKSKPSRTHSYHHKEEIINPKPLWIWPPALDSKSFGFCFTFFEASEEERPKPDFNLLKKANSEVLASTAADENQIHHFKIWKSQSEAKSTHMVRFGLQGNGSDEDQHPRMSHFSCVSNLLPKQGTENQIQRY